jgi:DNA polymerase IV (DinB-like DNA polymerase)
MSTLNPEENNHEKRIVMHVGMDSFYASVEVREHPELKGKPVCVVMKYNPELRRGAVNTCSYEARKFRVHSAMPIAKASKLCHDCVFSCRMDLFRIYNIIGHEYMFRKIPIL